MPTIRITITYGSARRSSDGGITRGSSGGASMVMVPLRVAGAGSRRRASKISRLIGSLPLARAACDAGRGSGARPSWASSASARDSVGPGANSDSTDHGIGSRRLASGRGRQRFCARCRPGRLRCRCRSAPRCRRPRTASPQPGCGVARPTVCGEVSGARAPARPGSAVPPAPAPTRSTVRTPSAHRQRRAGQQASANWCWRRPACSSARR